MGDKKTYKEMIKPVGLGLQVAEALTRAILEGDYKGGDQLLELELQDNFGVSRSPLREAFRELEKKGLVEIVPRRGTFVKRITRRDIEENFPIRAALEGLAAQLAMPNMTEESLTLMAEELYKMECAVETSDTQAFYTHHLAFHELFIELSENRLLINNLRTLRMQNIWHRFSYQYYQEDLEKSLRVHQKIFEGFTNFKKQPEKCRKLVEEHINIALDRFLTYSDGPAYNEPPYNAK